MNDKLNNKLSRLVIETLEQLAYMFFSQTDVDMDISTSEPTTVAVAFSGPFSGRLTMSITEPVLKELTANMLGLDEHELTIADQSDALKEAINILCGNFLPEIGGNQSIFNIDSPNIMADKKITQIAGEKPVAAANIEVDDEICAIQLFVNGEISEDAFNLE